MVYDIRDAVPAQIPQLEALEHVCFSDPWTAQQLESQLKGPQNEFITAVDTDGRVLGYVGMMYVLDEGYISNVAVDPEFRRQGIADALISRMCEISATLGLSFVTLEVRAGNAPAIALYKKHGFQPVGLRKGYYEKPREDALLMTFFLNRGNSFENTCI